MQKTQPGPLDPASIEGEIAQDEDRPVRVTIEAVDSGATRVAITCGADDANSAMRTANERADAFATQQRARIMGEAWHRIASSWAAEQRIRQEMEGLQPRMETLSERIAALAVPPPELPATPSEVTVPDNGVDSPDPLPEESAPRTEPLDEAPEWVEARTRLDELKRRQAELLVDRTPAHPEVQQIELQLAEAEHHLAGIAQQIEAARAVRTPPSVMPNKTPAVAKAPAVQVPGTDSQSPFPAGRAARFPPIELLHSVQTLKGGFDQVMVALRPDRSRHVAAVQGILTGGDITVQWAEWADTAPAGIGWGYWAIGALASGLAATAGVGMVWLGASIDVPLAGPGDVQRFVGVPLLGEVQVGRGTRSGAGTARSAAPWKWPCLLCGVAVLAAYAVFLL